MRRRECIACCASRVVGRAPGAVLALRSTTHYATRVMQHEGAAMPDHFRIVNVTRDVVLAERAELATSWWARAKGLLGRRELPAGEGLVIRPCNSVHCFFMAFTIDVIY